MFIVIRAPDRPIPHAFPPIDVTDFILGLEQGYPSTVSTIVRTCAKLQPKGEVDGKCILCGRYVPCFPCHKLRAHPSIRPSQRGIQEWKARISVREQPPPPPPADGTSVSPPTAPIVGKRPAPAPLTPYLCYPCHTTLTSRSARPVPSPWPNDTQPSVVSLPIWTEARLSATSADVKANDEEVVRQRKMGQDEMKGIVDECLLED